MNNVICRTTNLRWFVNIPSSLSKNVSNASELNTFCPKVIMFCTIAAYLSDQQNFLKLSVFSASISNQFSVLLHVEWNKTTTQKRSNVAT